MTLSMVAVVAILFAAIVLFVTEWLRVDMVALGVVVSLMLTGVLTTSEALAGFSNAAVMTIAALFVIGGAVMQTGLADLIGRHILNAAGKYNLSLPIVLMVAAALMSSFMSDTGTVAVLLPVVVMMARSARLTPSKLLIPMAFGSLIGGAMTLIGTPPNIIVSDILRSNGLEPFSFFSYTPLGLSMLVVAVLFLFFIGQRLLPERQNTEGISPLETHQRLLTDYHLQDDMCRLRVRLGSPLIGMSVQEANLRHDYDIDLLKIMQPPQPRKAYNLLPEPLTRKGRGEVKRLKSIPVLPQPQTPIGLDDVLIVMGDEAKIADAALRYQLAIQPPVPKDSKALIGRELGVAEVVIARGSQLVGKTLTQVHFQNTYRLNVLSLFRPNHGVFDDVRNTVLQLGDTLIVHGTWDNMRTLKQDTANFIVLGQPEALAEPPTRHKVGWALAILLAMVVAMVGEWLPLTQTALVAAGLMVLSGCLTMDDAYRAIDWKSLVLIAGMIPMSTALAKVGMVDVVATGLVNSLGAFGPLAVLSGLFVLTALFTQFISNTATVVVVGPIAFGAAAELGVQPQAFLMAVAVAGSMAFATPVASPVNTLVMAAGNYNFKDYTKVGVPLILLALIISIIVLPLLFPF